MSAPEPVAEGCDDGRVLIPRFAVVQGTKADGSPKVRAVDDCSVAGVNKVAHTRRAGGGAPRVALSAEATRPLEKWRHDTVDALFEVSQRVSRASWRTAPARARATTARSVRRAGGRVRGQLLQGGH